MLHVGLLGLGFIGKAHLAAFERIDNVQVSAIATAGSPVDDTFRHYTDPRALIADETVDAVVIALPTDLHTEFAVAALEAGKDVLIEKPVALTLADAARIEAAAGSGVAMVAHVLRHSPEYVIAERWARSGELGDIISAHTQRLSASPMWSGWHSDPSRGGGALFDLLVHDFDLLGWLLGPPVTVHARGHRGAGGAWDHVEVSMGFGDRQVVAHVHGGQLMPRSYPFTAELHLLGSTGAAEVRIRHDGEQIDGTAASTVVKFTDDGPQAPAVPHRDPFVAQAQAFVSAVQTRRVPAGLSVKDATAALQIAVAAQQSLISGEEVVLAEV